MTQNSSLRTSAALLLIGQLLYIGVTLFHAGGDANHHTSVFAGYAHSDNWKPVHLGQFLAMAILLAGLANLCFAIETRSGTARQMARAGAAATAIALGLYAVLQAVDGIALKQAVDAWMNAPAGEKAARFAAAESIRWLEWGTRSYHDITLGLALVLLAGAAARAASIPRPMAILIAMSGVAYLVQGWVLGVEGFSQTETLAIVAAYVLDVAWMVWLVVLAWRKPKPQTELPVKERDAAADA